MTPQDQLLKAELLLAQHPVHYLKIQRQLDEEYDDELQMTQHSKAHKAIRLVEEALGQKDELSKSELRTAYKLMVHCYLNLGEPDALSMVLSTLDDLLQLDSDDETVCFALESCSKLCFLLVTDPNDINTYLLSEALTAIENHTKTLKKLL